MFKILCKEHYVDNSEKAKKLKIEENLFEQLMKIRKIRAKNTAISCLIEV